MSIDATQKGSPDRQAWYENYTETAASDLYHHHTSSSSPLTPCDPSPSSIRSTSIECDGAVLPPLTGNRFQAQSANSPTDSLGSRELLLRPGRTSYTLGVAPCAEDEEGEGIQATAVPVSRHSRSLSDGRRFQYSSPGLVQQRSDGFGHTPSSHFASQILPKGQPNMTTSFHPCPGTDFGLMEGGLATTTGEEDFGVQSGSGIHGNGEDGGPVRTKKKSEKARERLRITLAPDQPLTTQGKQRERVYVACQQCRGRKIRCDGGRPMCFNCNQRGSDICNYDPIPKRRGPDRNPGSRQRGAKGEGGSVRRRRRAMNEDSGHVSCLYGSSQGLSVSMGFDARGSMGSKGSVSSSISDSSRTSRKCFPGPNDFPPGGEASNSFTNTSDGISRSFGNRQGPSDPLASSASIVDSSLYTRTNVASQESPVPSDPPITFQPPFPNSFSAAQGARDTISFSPSKSGYRGATETITYNSMLSAPYVDPPHQTLVNGNLANTTALSEVPLHYQQRETIGASSSSAPCAYGGVITVPEPRLGVTIDENVQNYNPYRWVLEQKEVRTPVAPTSYEEQVASVSYGFTSVPSLEFIRKTWWDSLLDTYIAAPYCPAPVSAHYEKVYNIPSEAFIRSSVNGTMRQRASFAIQKDLQSLFQQSNFWFAFINVPLFFRTFFSARNTVQPALVLSILTFANFMKSSAAELGEEGRRRTYWLRDKAQAALDASINGGDIDAQVAQAAWILNVFEISSHPMRSVSRIHSSLETLDGIIRVLSLSFIDADSTPSRSPSSSVSPSSSPSTSQILPMPLYDRHHVADSPSSAYQNPSQLLQYRFGNIARPIIMNDYANTGGCLCNDLCLARNWVDAKKHVPFWLTTPAWKSSWSDHEIRREECRRLSWNTLLLLAAYTTYRTSMNLNVINLFLLHPSNFRNVFPGENLLERLYSPDNQPNTTVETVWALYARSMLLWLACLRINNVSNEERSVFAQSVWLEAEAIENALNGHTCDTERSMLYQGREYLFNARCFVSQEFRRFVPHPSFDVIGGVHRMKAEEFLTHQSMLCKKVMQGLQTVTGLSGNVLARRPFFTFWFMAHVSRCVQLWKADKSLVFALDLAKNFLAPINYLAALWPCDDQRRLYAKTHADLTDACLEAGLSPPPPINPAFPLPSRFSPLP